MLGQRFSAASGLCWTLALGHQDCHRRLEFRRFFLCLLANGKQFGLKHINYTHQEGEGGIADALALAEHSADGQKICVVLGDNIIEENVATAADCFRKQPAGAHLFLKRGLRFRALRCRGSRRR
jgi:hypothetical protein